MYIKVGLSLIGTLGTKVSDVWNEMLIAAKCYNSGLFLANLQLLAFFKTKTLLRLHPNDYQDRWAEYPMTHFCPRKGFSSKWFCFSDKRSLTIRKILRILEDGVTKKRVSKGNVTNTGSIIFTINIDTQVELKYVKLSHFPFIKQQSNAI